MLSRKQILLAAAVLALGLTALWRADVSLFLPGLLQGTLVTLQITLAGCALAVVMAFLAGFARLYGPRPLRWLAVAYIELFRGTSALVQLFWLFFVLPQLGVSLPAIAAAIVALGLNVGAYGAEVVRGAMNSVARGQWEAATALNMSRASAITRIILPQALVSMVPPFGNLFIELLKATSLVSLITISDLTFRAQQMNQTTFRTVEIFTLVLVIYLVLSLAITFAMRLVERAAAGQTVRGRAG